MKAKKLLKPYVLIGVLWLELIKHSASHGSVIVKTPTGPWEVSKLRVKGWKLA